MIVSLDFYECLSLICAMLHVTCLDFYDMFNTLGFVTVKVYSF